MNIKLTCYEYSDSPVNIHEEIGDECNSVGSQHTHASKYNSLPINVHEEINDECNNSSVNMYGRINNEYNSPGGSY